MKEVHKEFFDKYKWVPTQLKTTTVPVGVIYSEVS